jgi:hypothetical protein
MTDHHHNRSDVQRAIRVRFPEIARIFSEVFSCLLAMLIFSRSAGAAADSFEALDCHADDATRCWQEAIRGAMPPEKTPYFAGLTARMGARYIIRDTLTIESAYGGTIDGNGSVLEWRGPPDRPMFLVKNTQQVRFVNLRIFVVTPLEAAFEFTKAPYGKDSARNVAPSLNVIDSVRIEGVKLGNLRYGIRFSKRYGIDEDNDQSTIINTAIYNVTDAAISIEHTQSQHHHFYAVKAGGADGNKNASFVRAQGGSFSSLGGFHGGFGGAVYSISSVYGTDLIIDEDSEASARFIRTPAGSASFPFPVYVVGGRFSVDRVASDGKFIDFNRMGPLGIDGLRVDGIPPAGVANPVISFLPDPVDGKGQGKLAVVNVAFTIPGSGSWEVLAINGATGINSSGNTCVDERGAIVLCRGLANGISNLGGLTFKELSVAPVRDLAPGHVVYCADCAVEERSGACAGGGQGRVARKSTGGWSCN